MQGWESATIRIPQPFGVGLAEVIVGVVWLVIVVSFEAMVAGDN